MDVGVVLVGFGVMTVLAVAWYMVSEGQSNQRLDEAQEILEGQGFRVRRLTMDTPPRSLASMAVSTALHVALDTRPSRRSRELYPCFIAINDDDREVEGFVTRDGEIRVTGETLAQAELDERIEHTADERTLAVLDEPQNKDLDTGERRALRERVGVEVREQLLRERG